MNLKIKKMKKLFLKIINFFQVENTNNEVEELKEKLLFENNMRVQAVELLAKTKVRLNERLVKNLNQEREIRNLKDHIRTLEKKLELTERMYKNRTQTSLNNI